MLTMFHRKLFVNAIKRKYDIDVGLYQIEILKLKTCTCTIDLNETVIEGSVKSFERYPLRIDFNARSGTTEAILFDEILKSEEPLEIQCKVTAKDFKQHLYLSTDKDYIKRSVKNTITICNSRFSLISSVYNLFLDELGLKSEKYLYY